MDRERREGRHRSAKLERLRRRECGAVGTLMSVRSPPAPEPPRSIIQMTAPRSVRRAIRSPVVSSVPHATAFAIVATRPTLAITSARIANALHSLANTISWLMVRWMSASWDLIFVERHAVARLVHICGSAARSGADRRRAQRIGHFLQLRRRKLGGTAGRPPVDSLRAEAVVASRRRRPRQCGTGAARLEPNFYRSPMFGLAEELSAKRSLTTTTGGFLGNRPRRYPVA